MAAMEAQSSMLPSSSRKCTSTRNDQTYHPAKQVSATRSEGDEFWREVAHFLSRDDAERFPVDGVTSPQGLFQ
jgi:hypothetical protein